jgi:hypothetical protein
LETEKPAILFKLLPSWMGKPYLFPSVKKGQNLYDIGLGQYSTRTRKGDNMRKYLILVVIVLLLQACGSASSASPSPVIPITASTAASIAPTTEPIVHSTIPTEGNKARATAHDNENAQTFEKKAVSTGDDFLRNRFERPFTSNDMAYLPDLDIVDFSITSDDTFFYIKISFTGLDPATRSLKGFYGVEIDRDRDGRAEILLATKPPYTTEFSADHAYVYIDLNGDVGGSVINRPDASGGDGFEAAIFDLSKGVYPEGDPDLAWVKQTTDGDRPAIEIAYKKWIFKDGKEAFFWSVLASGNEIDPTRLYVQDHMTAEQAGAANTDDPNYPIKELAAFDNSCRVPLGFEAQGFEPLGCFVKGSDKDVPDEPSPDSTCGQFGTLCNRIKDRFVLLAEQK